MRGRGTERTPRSGNRTKVDEVEHLEARTSLHCLLEMRVFNCIQLFLRHKNYI